MAKQRQPEGDYRRDPDRSRYRRTAALRAGAGAAAVVVVTSVAKLGDDAARALLKAGDDVGAAAASASDDVVAHTSRSADGGEIAGRVAEEVATRAGIEAMRRASDDEEP